MKSPRKRGDKPPPRDDKALERLRQFGKERGLDSTKPGEQKPEPEPSREEPPPPPPDCP